MASLDETTLSTLSLLEARLLRLEHLLYGQTASPSLAQNDAAAPHMANLEKRFSMLVSKVRVYGELLKIYNTHPSFFHSPPPSEPPSQLSPDAIQSIVLASASSYHATLSSLTAVKDSPVPDPAESAALVALSERMKAIQATQAAHAAEISELRGRSETAIRSWYKGVIVNTSQCLADVESRIEKAERQVRRAEHMVEADEKI
ncbi:hypothetical protein N3K66_000723 [Trichothecium roseum]|uniref:Uncharacterized protein n=1 Tax=Trichothecium roseum TaxID=47278 RepID=A0ACC0VCQ6_9HYPO|nr:hypothetical protein N3K66_000723 [Trichothecium roseum]